jgi:hypothetical protein
MARSPLLASSWSDARTSIRSIRTRRTAGFFSTTEADTNKAGQDGPHFRSYGTITADGILALLALGHARNSPRVMAAQRWLTSHHRDLDVPGFTGEAYQLLAARPGVLLLGVEHTGIPSVAGGRRGWCRPGFAADAARRRVVVEPREFGEGGRPPHRDSVRDTCVGREGMNTPQLRSPSPSTGGGSEKNPFRIVLALRRDDLNTLNLSGRIQILMAGSAGICQMPELVREYACVVRRNVPEQIGATSLQSDCIIGELEMEPNVTRQLDPRGEFQEVSVRSRLHQLR